MVILRRNKKIGVTNKNGIAQYRKDFKTPRSYFSHCSWNLIAILCCTLSEWGKNVIISQEIYHQKWIKKSLKRCWKFKLWSKYWTMMRILTRTPENRKSVRLMAAALLTTMTSTDTSSKMGQPMMGECNRFLDATSFSIFYLLNYFLVGEKKNCSNMSEPKHMTSRVESLQITGGPHV